MGLRKKIFVVDEYYHLYNRGIEKRIIFLDEEDYKHFIYLLYLCNTKKSITLREINIRSFDRGEPIVAIGAYCLMPNHFHILAREKISNGISLYMRKILTAYSMYFNKKYERTGRLYENIFKSSHIGDDVYLKYLYAYIHLNPAKLIDSGWKENRNRNVKVLLDHSMSYSYSSFQEYKSGRFKVLSIDEFPKYFPNLNDHQKELFGWLSSSG